MRCSQLVIQPSGCDTIALPWAVVQLAAQRTLDPSILVRVQAAQLNTLLICFSAEEPSANIERSVVATVYPRCGGGVYEHRTCNIGRW